MSKKVPVVKFATPQAAGELEGLPLQATVAMADVAAAMSEGLLAFATSAGLVVMQQMLTEELTVDRRSEARQARRRAGRELARHDDRSGRVGLAEGERRPGPVAATSTAARSSWRRGSASLLRICCARWWWSGCSPGSPPAATSTSPNQSAWRARRLSKSAVSRRFKAATEAAMGDLLARDLSDLETAVLMIDGLSVADQMIVVALVITADGTKVPVGLMLGDTENHVVVTDLLADLVARGLRYDHGIVAVLDGSKALRKAVAKVFGDRALVQRCTLHKRRNVTGYLPVGERDAVDQRLARAFADPDPAKGLKRVPGARPPTRQPPPRRRRLTARRARGDVHHRQPRRHRPAPPVVDQHQLHRVDDLHRPHHHRPSEATGGTGR